MSKRERLPPELLKVERSMYYELIEYMVNEQRGRMIDAWDELLRAGLNEVRARRSMEAGQ